MSTAPLAPTAPTERIQAIDAVRGFALLGIFLVNIITFSDAFGTFMDMQPPVDGGAADRFAHYFTITFGTGKFYPLFSLLFGMGLAIQWRRAHEAGRSLWGTGVRRLIILGTIGLAHALLLWYGDILFLYSTAGVVLLLLVRARPRTLARIGAVMLSVSVLLSAGLGVLMVTMDQASQTADAAAGNPPAAAPPEPTAEATESTPLKAEKFPIGGPFGRLMEAMQSEQAREGPRSPIWIETEREAYREGPFLQAFLFRGMTWLFFLIYAALGMWWHIVAMFLLGAALLKAGLFAPERRRWHVRFLTLGALVGLPAAIATAVLPSLLPTSGAMLLVGPLMLLGGPLLSLGYLSGITILVESGKLRPVTSALASVGRMALTNYLLQTLLATGVFYWWGLGLFGRVGEFRAMLLVLGIYLCQIPLSMLWLRVFRFGPMEWLWRSLTYLRPQPMLAHTPA